MVFSIFQNLSLLAVFQLLVLTLGLWIKSGQGNSWNKTFVFFLLINAYISLVSFLFYSNYLQSFLGDAVLLVSLSMFFLLGPFLYFFFKEVFLCKPARFRSYSLHLIPAVLSFLLFGGVWVIEIRSGILPTFPINENQYIVYQAIAFAHLQAYILFTVREYRAYRKSISDHSSSIDVRSLNWLRILLVVYFLHWLAEVSGFSLTVMGWLPFDGGLWFYAVSLLMLLVFSTLTVIRGMAGFGIVNFSNNIPKYSASALTQIEKQHIQEKLENFIAKHQPYLDPDLTISQLADKLELSVKPLSQVINESYQCNFFDFINKKRIDKAREILLHDMESENPFTIQQIFYDSGFNSKSAFNRAFKKYLQCTPTEYRQQLVKSRKVAG
ncbi:MAG: AraC family transcriptional regulator [Bacteroidales bacterium]|nr:AraC family transcriptional regulator [Bacteroidales bacterium]MCF8402874.1 AraC family transcriptional regulator [Bacteroidales bacterium]